MKMKISKTIDNIKPSLIFKTIGLVLVGAIILSLVLQLIKTTFSPVSYRGNMIEPSYDMGYGAPPTAQKLSIRNVAPEFDEEYSSGSNAEAFEVTEHFATIETRNATKDCRVISDLKASADIIFENSNEYDRGCNYTFKTIKDRVPQVLLIIESLDPKDIRENTFSIKRQVDDFTNEVEVLNKKKNSIEKTLEDAVNAYDEIAKLATKTQDAESLAKIIDSKIRIIERLTQEKININERLERLSRSKEEQLDRLNYTYFHVNIFENKYFDIKIIKDSWKTSIKRFVTDTNNILQNITINLVTLLFRAIQFVLYFFIILIVAKYTIRAAKNLWTK